MGTHMKTTVDIADPLLNRAKKLAAQEGITLREVIERGLRKVLADSRSNTRFTLRDASVGGKGLHPDARAATWEQIREMSYEDERD